jgi:hypothetical protein
MSAKKRRQRTARKLLLPAIAILMMTTMMFMEAHARSQQAVSSTLSAERAGTTAAP